MNSKVGAPSGLREGDERLGGTKHGEGDGGANASANRPARTRKDKNPVGRALRTVYDDTLRESVPDDFLDLLRKLD